MKTIYTLSFITLYLLSGNLRSQSLSKDTIKRMPSSWWIGQSIGGNFNYYRGTTQRLNETVTTSAPFHNGDGLRLYFSFLAEYRPNKTLGTMLNVAFSNRSSSFDGIITPGNEKAFLYTVLRYLNIEPSLRLAPFSSAFYIFAGPLVSINTTKEFFYQEGGKYEARGDWSDLRKFNWGAQGGLGIDIPISQKSSINQVSLSPFASFQTNFNNRPRRTESWSIYTVRTGLAVKFSTHKRVIPNASAIPSNDAGTAGNGSGMKDTLRIYVKDIQFSAQSIANSNEEAANEIFPLCHSIFFNAGSTAIPQRYVQLTASAALNFKESQLQAGRPVNWYNSRAQRQLDVYYQLLNILGSRMRNYPQSTITLSAGKATRVGDGAAMAAQIKRYLVTSFGIDAARIITGVDSEMFITSVQSGNNRTPALRQQDDRRVDIASSSPELMQPFNSSSAEARATEPSVLFTAAGAGDQLQSWWMDVTNNGTAMHYGPYKQDTILLPVSALPGDARQGMYTIEMGGTTRNGQAIHKTTRLSLPPVPASAAGTRYAVLFDFNSFKALTGNRQFLENTIAPLVTDSSTVIIHGHADIIGNEIRNRSLSNNRVNEARHLLEAALNAKGRKGVKFEYYGFGQDKIMSPFGNQLPEERFYNRTVIIDIIQGR